MRAGNSKDPMLTQATIQFGDKAVLELLRSKDLVSNEIIGRDQDGQKKVRADRVTEAMNYQVNHDMNKWRKKHAAMLYTLPNTGTTFKKTVHDPIRDITESFIIRYPDFAVNQATEDMEEARAFSHIMDFSKNEIEVKVRSGLWIDADLFTVDEKAVDKQGQKGSNEDKKVTDAIDNQDKFIEQQTFFDLDDDDYEDITFWTRGIDDDDMMMMMIMKTSPFEQGEQMMMCMMMMMIMKTSPFEQGE